MEAGYDCQIGKIERKSVAIRDSRLPSLNSPFSGVASLLADDHDAQDPPRIVHRLQSSCGFGVEQLV